GKCFESPREIAPVHPTFGIEPVLQPDAGSKLNAARLGEPHRQVLAAPPRDVEGSLIELLVPRPIGIELEPKRKLHAGAHAVAPGGAAQTPFGGELHRDDLSRPRRRDWRLRRIDGALGWQ